MVANYRCTELKDEALSQIEPKLCNLKTASEHLNESFKADAIAIIECATTYYNDVAKQYDQLVFRKIQKDLVREVLKKVFSCFDSQIKVVRQMCYTKVEQDVKKLEKK